MPRPKKCRRVCALPPYLEFAPVGGRSEEEPVGLWVDEYETIRLIDQEGLSQEECGERMGIARATVQQIYTSARHKLADMLADGRPLRIEGGRYRLCDGTGTDCGCAGCCRCRTASTTTRDNKGGNKMRVAIPVDDTKKAVCVSFGRAPYFLFHDLDTGVTEIKVNPAAEADSGAGLKAAQAVLDGEADFLITVRCGENAAEVMKAAEIKIYKAEGSDAEENLTAFKEKKLAELTHFHAGFHGVQ